MTQILQSFGGGFAAVSSQVGAQASVSHKYVAMVTAIVLLITELGGAIGSAIGSSPISSSPLASLTINVNRTGGAIWTHLMPSNLRKYLPNATEQERMTLFGSIISIAALSPDDPTRQGVISAYSDTMRVLIIVALAFGILPVLIALSMPNFYLGDAQNAVDGRDIAGRRVEDENISPSGADHAPGASTSTTAKNKDSVV